MANKRILVCGGRDFTNRDLMFKTLYDLCDEFGLWSVKDEYGNTLPDKVIIISGKARGADTLAIDWAVINWIDFEEYPALWEIHGRKAGPIRNQQMIDEGKPDIVIAFKGGVGTQDMIRRARKHNIPVRIIEE